MKTTTKIKIFFYGGFIILLILLFASVWSDPTTKEVSSFLSSIPAFFNAISIKTWAGMAIVFILLIGNALYAQFEKAQQRIGKRELPIIAIQEEAPTAQPFKEVYTPGREADWLQWHDAYEGVIIPFIQAGKSKDEIIEELKKRRLPFSKYTDIRIAGDAGKLKKFETKKSI